jgi:hypothetical protein
MTQEVAVAAKGDNKITVQILYNGMTKTVEANARQAVNALLQHAIGAFEGVTNAHTLSLFDEAGNELNEQQSVSEAGIREGAKLALRTSAVKGG